MWIIVNSIGWTVNKSRWKSFLSLSLSWCSVPILVALVRCCSGLILTMVLTINQRETHLLWESPQITDAFDTFCRQKYFHWKGILELSSPASASWASQGKRKSMSHLIEVHQTLLPDHWIHGGSNLQGPFIWFFSFNFLIAQSHVRERTAVQRGFNRNFTSLNQVSEIFGKLLNNKYIIETVKVW